MSRMSATRSGNSRCRSWWPGEARPTAPWRLGQRLGLRAPLGVRALGVAAVGQEQERRRFQRRPAHRRPVLRQRAHDGQMAVALQPRLDGAVGTRAETMQVRADGAFAEAAGSCAFIRASSSASARWSRRGGVIAVRQSLDRGKPVGQLDDPAVDARDTADDLRMAPAELQHDVAAPTIGPPAPADRGPARRQREQVGERRRSRGSYPPSGASARP